MSKSDFTEHHLKEMLQKMPKIEDSRSKDTVLEQLKEDPRLRKKSANRKWGPAFVAAAAVLLLAILVPSFLQKSEETVMEQRSMQQNDKVPESEETAVTMESLGDEVRHYVLYPEDTAGYTVFHLGMATEEATIVPVSYLIPQEQIVADFGTRDPHSVDLYNEYAGRIDEQALGFTEYHPIQGKVEADNDQVVIMLDREHPYDMASATLEMFQLAVRDSFYGFSEATLVHDDGSPVVFEQVGEPMEPIELLSGHSQQAYYLYTKQDGQQVLSSNFGQSYESIGEAMEAMKAEPNDVYLSVIPDSLDFAVIDQGDSVIIKFLQPLDLEAYDTNQMVQMIEGILLAGASFQKSVQFENVIQTNWNGFDFAEPLPMPIGPNPLPFHVE